MLSILHKNNAIAALLAPPKDWKLLNHPEIAISPKTLILTLTLSLTLAITKSANPNENGSITQALTTFLLFRKLLPFSPYLFIFSEQ